MKVKLLWSHFLPDLDKKINEFIQGKKIIDIKFTEVVSDDYGKGDWSALVMYEEKRNRHFKQKEFNISDGEDPNEFIKVHDVVNAVTLKDENNELVTVVIYEDEENSR